MQLTRPMEAATALGPTEAQRDAWRDADHAARPARLERLRERLASEGIDAYFGVRPENSRYLTGFTLGDGEEKVSGSSGRFLVSADETIVLADSRYRLQAEEQCPTTRVEPISGDVEVRWRELVGGLRPIAGGGSGGRVTRVAVEAAFVSHALWSRLADADPSVELVPVIGWVEALRAVKEPAELERIEAACGVADAALTATLADIRPGVSEQELALALEWRIRTGGAEALAFDVACLSGHRAALPHGSPGSRAIVAGEVLLFDFGAQVAGYRSDMTRTLFVGEPSTRDLALHELVASAQRAAIEALEAALAERRPAIDREIDQVARAVIEAAGHGDHFGHGLGHGIGLATHELPSLGRSGGAVLPSPTVFSVEPGVYLDGVTGVRIEDLVAFDAEAATLRTLTRFPRGVTVVGV